jgi:AraC-like DNA-binding protein
MSDIADSSNMIPTSDYREHAPVAALDRHVACVWTQRIGPGSTPMVQRIVPDGCVDIVWLDCRLHVAGPDTGPVLAPLNPGSLVVGVRFRPGLAPTMLGLPASELIDDRVDLDVLWGRAAGRLAGRLSDAAGPGAAVRLLEGELVERLPGAAPVDPFVEAVVAELRAGPPAPVVAKLAATLGTSERQLHRRCLDAFGYGPKTLDRVLRFQRFLSMARSAAPLGHVGLARLAADTGYADQAHLAQECRSLGGVPPRRLLG